jgi:hypothetical protein
MGHPRMNKEDEALTPAQIATLPADIPTHPELDAALDAAVEANDNVFVKDYTPDPTSADLLPKHYYRSRLRSKLPTGRIHRAGAKANHGLRNQAAPRVPPSR